MQEIQSLRDLQNAVGGYIEHVNPAGLPSPYCLICNEEGLLKGLPFNPIASKWYGTHLHGNPIVGPVVVLKEVTTPDGDRDFGGLSPLDVDTIQRLIADNVDFGDFLTALFG